MVMYLFISALQYKVGGHQETPLSPPDHSLAVVVVLHHELDCPLQGPAQGVDPSVHHQPAGSEHLRPKVAKPHQRILIEAELVAQRLTVQTPALTEASVYWEPKTGRGWLDVLGILGIWRYTYPGFALYGIGS